MTLDADRGPAGLRHEPLSWLRHSIEIITVGLYFSYCVIVLMQVFFRYILNDSLIWSEETVRFEQFWVIMLATSLCAFRKSHIRLEGIEAMMPAGMRGSLELLNDIVTIGCSAVLIWYGSELALHSLVMKSPAMQITMALPYAAVPVGSALTILWTVLGWFQGKKVSAH